MLSAMPPVVVTILLRLGAEGVEPPRLSPRMTGIFTAKPVKEAATMMPPGSQSPSASKMMPKMPAPTKETTRDIARRFIYGPIFLPCMFVDIRNKSVRRSVRACASRRSLAVDGSTRARTPGVRSACFAIDCRRHGALLTSSAPQAKGGIAIAPRGFGAFAADGTTPE